MRVDILVLGGGASGLAAAISAKDAAPQKHVLIAEALDRCGKKLLATGNGRCNIMNTGANEDSYMGDRAFIKPALDLYKSEYERFWDSLGVPLITEDEGRMYPKANQANAVLDALRLGLAERGVDEITGFRATKIQPLGQGFNVLSADKTIFCNKLIFACGGKAGKGLGENGSLRSLLKPLGHSATELLPALCCLKSNDNSLKALKGIRLKCEVSLYDGESLISSERGEALFQEDGISGIAVMQLSLLAAKGLNEGRSYCLEISLLGKDSEAKLRDRIRKFPTRQLNQLFTGELNRLIALAALKRANVKADKTARDLSNDEILRLSNELSHWRIPVTDSGSFERAQLMLGGLNTNEFDAQTMESRLVKGLYAAGEALNVNGPCGGYNLEWAWASGILAGREAAKAL